jgi:plastocyanin
MKSKFLSLIAIRNATLVMTVIVGMGCFSIPAGALENRMDDARDMLRSERESAFEDGDENQNSDATSKWGQSSRSKNVAEIRKARVVSPIGDSSFEMEVGPSRAPASESRAPATLSAHQAVLKPSDAGDPAMANIRAAKKEKAYQESAIIASDQGFFPSTVFVTQGIPVRLFVTGASVKAQCFIMDSFGVRRQVKNQKIEEIRFVPESPGTYNFNCPMNGARGTVVVRDSN